MSDEDFDKVGATGEDDGAEGLSQKGAMLLWLILFAIVGVAVWRGRHSKVVVIRKYRTLLGVTLERQFGPGPKYRATDVTRAMRASHVPTKFSRYAMYCDATEFAKGSRVQRSDLL